MHVQYKAIAGAGIIARIDDPDLPHAWQIHSEFSTDQYREGAAIATKRLWGR